MFHKLNTPAAPKPKTDCVRKTDYNEQKKDTSNKAIAR